jgi:ankyrin repeat protein
VPDAYKPTFPVVEVVGVARTVFYVVGPGNAGNHLLAHVRRGIQAEHAGQDTRRQCVGRDAAAVALLLDRGADPSATAPDGSTPLGEAAYAGDAAVFHLLLQRGAKAQAAGVLALYLATTFGCEPCVADLVPAFDRTVLTGAMAELAPLQA